MAIKLKLELKWTKIKRVVTMPRGLNLCGSGKKFKRCCGKDR